MYTPYSILHACFFFLTLMTTGVVIVVTPFSFFFWFAVQGLRRGNGTAHLVPRGRDGPVARPRIQRFEGDHATGGLGWVEFGRVGLGVVGLG